MPLNCCNIFLRTAFTAQYPQALHCSNNTVHIQNGSAWDLEYVGYVEPLSS